MQVSDPNNVKIYNLSAGKSLPEWLSEKKRRALLKKNVDVRRRIELIQDFDMPGLSTTVKVSNDGQYVLATGIYKPRIKCFDVNNLSLKFERCFDSEAVTFEILSDDYSKLAFLQCDRYIEFHAAHGRYHRLRIPKFGRDMKYNFSTCDLYVVGASSEIYRLNLERGQFMTPFTSNASSMNKCDINTMHNLLVCGTQEGRVEAWDPRTKDMVASLDCAFSCVNENKGLERFPSISALKFNGGLQLGVGTVTGQILLYDIRSKTPFYIKDHMYGLPIKDIYFHYQQNLVFSLDSSVLKIWEKNNGKLYTSIEASTEFNNLCTVPNTGLLFLANENTKIQTYYIPSLGPAPKWASFLDSLTEELEESNAEIVYDDYKFVTKQELENLGLDHLIGTNLLRAYMHGYFMDVRFYKKIAATANPFAWQEYLKNRNRQKIETDRSARLVVNKLPTVNKEFALKLLNNQNNKKKQNSSSALLNDNRFEMLFKNPDFEIDKNTEEYRLLNPVLNKVNKREDKPKMVLQDFEPMEQDNENNESSDDFVDSEESSDDENTWRELKKQHKNIKIERIMKERWEAKETNTKQPKMFELRQGEEFKGIINIGRKTNKATLGERLEKESSSKIFGSNHKMTFKIQKKREKKY